MMSARTPKHTNAAGKSVTIDVANDAAEIDRAQNDFIAAVESHGYPKASIFAMRLALHEAMSNAFRHGHAKLPAETPVTLRYAVNRDRVEIEIEDRGPGFIPEAIPDPTIDQNLERGSGRGLLLIRAYMSEATYNAKGNCLRMVYRLPKDQ